MFSTVKYSNYAYNTKVLRNQDNFEKKLTFLVFSFSFFQYGETLLNVSLQVTRQDEMFSLYFTNLKQVIDFYMNSKKNCGYCLIMR